MNEDSIIQEAVYPYPIWSVWKALTSAEALAQWLMPNDFAPKLGHRFTMQSAPRDGWNGVIECQVVALEPPHRVAYTWRGGGESSRIDTLVTFTLATEDQQTRLRLEHAGFASTGEAGLLVRDLLSRGWKSHVLQQKLPALLAQMSNQTE
ncbi:MAG TPA: SRPBCC domain-containing protein [Ktedonobacteraceae bacterium]